MFVCIFSGNEENHKGKEKPCMRRKNGDGAEIASFVDLQLHLYHKRTVRSLDFELLIRRERGASYQ